MALSLLAFAGCGGWIWYNTEVLNRLAGPKDVERVQAEYEKTYKPMDKLPQPRVRSVKYAIDVFPSSRGMSICVAMKSSTIPIPIPWMKFISPSTHSTTLD